MPDTQGMTRPAPTFSDPGFPDIGSPRRSFIGNDENSATQNPSHESPAASYFPVQTPQGGEAPWADMPGTVATVVANHEVDEYDRQFNTRDTDMIMDRPVFTVDYVRNPDYEIGGEAGKVNRNPYTMAAVVAPENFDLTGEVARIRRPSESRIVPDGPVTGLSVAQGSTWDVYAAGLAQSYTATPSDSDIALSLLGRGTNYDREYPA